MGYSSAIYPRSSDQQNLISSLPANVFVIQTPVKLDRLEFITRKHPNQPFVQYILDGFRKGFQYGFQGEYKTILQKNLPSIQIDSRAFTLAVMDEVQKKR